MRRAERASKADGAVVKGAGRWFAEIGHRLRISEDDYRGLRFLKPDGSTGKNFMLSKWRSTAFGSAIEWWDEAWAPVCAGDFVALEDGPAEVWLVINGTDAAYTTTVDWSLSANNICFDGDDFLIDEGISETGGTNVPQLVGPFGDIYEIPATVPSGLYYVCAGVNVDCAPETTCGDNNIISQTQWEVIGVCPE